MTTYVTVIEWYDQDEVEPPKHMYLWLSNRGEDIFNGQWDGYSWSVDGFGVSTPFEDMLWAYPTSPKDADRLGNRI